MNNKNIVQIICKTLLIIFSCVVLAYTSMAASVGPWIAPTIILLVNAVLAIFGSNTRSRELPLIFQASSSLAALAMTAIGFCLPTLYFLQPAAFDVLLANFWHFSLILGAVVALSLTVGTYGILAFGQAILANAHSCPVSQFFVSTNEQTSKSVPHKSLIFGSGLTTVICLVREYWSVNAGNFYALADAFSFFARPMMWAVGYTLGVQIIAPLLVGLFLQKLVIWPLVNYTSLITTFFPNNTVMSIGAALCCGILLFEVLTPLLTVNFYKTIYNFILTRRQLEVNGISRQTIFLLCSSLSLVGLLQLLHFSFLSAIAVVVAAIVCAIEITRFTNSYAMVPFGRFATFVMLPALALFALDNTQITWLCIVVTVVCAAAASLNIQYGVAKLEKLDADRMVFEHWFGVAVTSLVAGGVFWLLLKHLPLGGSLLFAQRGQMRALLINSKAFSPVLLLLGCCLAWVFKRLKLSLTMIFGGLLMPIELSVGLIVGALQNYWLPKNMVNNVFWTGVFSTEALLITVLLLLRFMFT